MIHARIMPDQPVATSAVAAALLAPCFAGLAREELRALHLDAELRLLRLSGAVSGEIAAVDLPLRAIMAEGLAIGTRALVIAHNHPRGDPCPSRADRQATRRLAEVARALDIRVIDHLVFAAARWISFRAMGLM